MYIIYCIHLLIMLRACFIIFFTIAFNYLNAQFSFLNCPTSSSPSNISNEMLKIIKLILDQRIPSIDPPEDTEYVKHIRIQS